jgi:hypothetical protein
MRHRQGSKFVGKFRPAIGVRTYGGAVITEAGNHESVAGLVYITAFAPDHGESVSTLIAGFPADGPQPPILPPIDGFLFLDRERFAASFAADVPAREAAFMADSQVPWGVEALNGTISDPAWRSKPSWYLIASDDRMIPPPAQRTMSERVGATTTEVPGRHAIYVSQPQATAELIKHAAGPHTRLARHRAFRAPAFTTTGACTAEGVGDPQRAGRAPPLLLASSEASLALRDARVPRLIWGGFCQGVG